MSLLFADLSNWPMCSTVLFSVTDWPTTPYVTPSGLRKSFCGSVITKAVRPGVMLMPGSGRPATANIGSNTDTSIENFIFRLVVFMSISSFAYYIPSRSNAVKLRLCEIDIEFFRSGIYSQVKWYANWCARCAQSSSY